MCQGTMTEIEIENAISLRNRRDAHTAEELSCRCLMTRHSMQRKPCWDVADQIDMIDTVLRGWICPPIYIISRTDVIDRCSQGEDHVFDGAHKLEAIFDFIDNKFAFKTKNGKFAELSGKLFKDMPKEIQERIKKYRFHINHVDEDTAKSTDELSILWQRVNKAGKQLTRYELDIPLIAPLIENVLEPMRNQFYGTPFFPKTKSHRGDLEQRLEILLALSDIEEPYRFTQNKLLTYWHTTKLGVTIPERLLSIEKYGEAWRDTLSRCSKMLIELEQLNVFCTPEGGVAIEEPQRKTELVFLLGRLAYRFPRIEEFRSQKNAIAARVKAELFAKGSHALSVELGGTGRESSFQIRLMKYVDELVCTLAGCVQPRLFTKAQKKERLKEQGGLCTLCGEKILAHHLVEGDHITEWSEGGATTMENLQVVHKTCHQAKISGTI